ncbi:MAG: hypothetical protein HY814_05900 [Candidatus Riflebacteria bacterium]|nr:hypothetical protein [Candidatus Riflebacteria bacterium]
MGIVLSPVAHADRMRALAPYLERVEQVPGPPPPEGWSEAIDAVWPRTWRLYATNGLIGFVYFENQRYRHSIRTIKALLWTLSIRVEHFLQVLSAVKTERGSVRP